MSSMTPRLRTYLASMSESENDKLRQDSLRMLRRAFPARHHSYEARVVARANVRMLRNLKALTSA